QVNRRLLPLQQCYMEFSLYQAHMLSILNPADRVSSHLRRHALPCLNYWHRKLLQERYQGSHKRESRYYNESLGSIFFSLIFPQVPLPQSLPSLNSYYDFVEFAHFQNSQAYFSVGDG